jgi:hypothetical protein
MSSGDGSNSGAVPIHERLNKAKIGNKRAIIRRTRSKSLDHLPAIDPVANAKIMKQFEHIQEAYKASPPVIPPSMTQAQYGGEKRRSIVRKTSNDDIIVGTSATLRARSARRPSTVGDPGPTARRPSRVLKRGQSKDDHDIPNDRPKLSPQPPSLQPCPPTSGRRGSMTPSRILKRGQSKDDSDLDRTVMLSTSHRPSPRKIWVSDKHPVENSFSPKEYPYLLLERPKLFWRQRISTVFYVYHHMVPSSSTTETSDPTSTSSSSPSRISPTSSAASTPDFTSSYLEIIPTDVERKGYQFERVYVSVATLIQMKSKEFNAIIESRPRSVTSRPYATREEIARVNQIKRDEKSKLLLETCADYCLENIDISAEESSQQHVVLILRKYHGKHHLPFFLSFALVCIS